MPPDNILSDEQSAAVRTWIEMGGPHPDADGEIPEPTNTVYFDTGQPLWAFLPSRPFALP